MYDLALSIKRILYNKVIHHPSYNSASDSTVKKPSVTINMKGFVERVESGCFSGAGRILSIY